MAKHAPVETSWTFLTNHSHVLICLDREPDVRMRDIAEQVGITERAVQKIIADLIEGGYVTATKVGRRNRYHVTASHNLRHPVESHRTVEDLLRLVR